ncbi:hypothetical protein [Streptomyces sp. NPDC005078]|uniref:hypothetical protein n=1 Tax=unclassified Streptomyces TaxID=2593676 RepID=UPI0033A71006
MPGMADPDKRVVIRLALTATAAQHDAVLADFQDFVRTVRPTPGRRPDDAPWGKVTGTRYPDTGVASLSTVEVRAALLALNGPEVPYVACNGTPTDCADLVAGCRTLELGLPLKTRMRPISGNREVRTLDEQREVSSPEYPVESTPVDR